MMCAARLHGAVVLEAQPEEYEHQHYQMYATLRARHATVTLTDGRHSFSHVKVGLDVIRLQILAGSGRASTAIALHPTYTLVTSLPTTEIALDAQQ